MAKNKKCPISPLGDKDEFGSYLGISNIAQIRFFNRPIDMYEMLNIDIGGTNGQDITATNYHPFDEFSHWSGDLPYIEDGSLVIPPHFPKESITGDIFISEYPQFKNNCLFELNCGILDGKTFRDTSGNGCKGILIGDYSIKKKTIGKPTTRDSYIKTPKIDSKDGAF